MFRASGAPAEDTGQHILETALRLFRARGFDQTTMRDVAAEAGIALGAAYYYFESKEAIVGAYYDYVQQEHLARAREGFARARDFRERLGVAFHAKIDILERDRKLLRALFRYGGEPKHPLSWFGPANRRQRELSVAVFEEAIGDERLPADLRGAAPVLLWTLHLGVLLYFLYDSSPGQKRTRRLIDAAVDFVHDARRFVTSPLLTPVRRRVMAILREAELVPESAPVRRSGPTPGAG
ncbi:MAG TPA: TetR/AcrR family transcriptional regulator [Methylomirabilota bacterium]|nr:TetR/AcrR family transcriptional regulator [Methylomirabilota bacterium]